MCRIYRRGYNSALLKLRRTMLKLSSGEGIAEDQRNALGAVELLCREMRLPTRPKPRLATFAKEYAVSLRTIKNWKRAGCPFDDGKRAVIEWMFQRKTLPSGAAQKFEHELSALSLRADVAGVKQAAKNARATGERRDRLLASLRLKSASEKVVAMDGKSILRHSREVLTLCKAANRVGQW